MDRVSIRSFRASDLAERGLKDLARSRLDTTREVAFQALGHRFFAAREDAARIAILFREDAFHAPDGHFTGMALRVEPHLAERLASLDPRAVEARLEEAARNAIVREWPRAQGAYLVRFEPSARGELEPVAHVHLISRRTDGGPAPALTREDSRRFEAVCSREVERAFGLSRGLARGLEREPPPDRTSVLRPERRDSDRSGLKLPHACSLSTRRASRGRRRRRNCSKRPRKRVPRGRHGAGRPAGLSTFATSSSGGCST